MSVYFVKGKGWRYDFTLNGNRHSGAGYEKKQEARQAEAKKREELTRPQPVEVSEIPTDMDFLELVNLRLDHVKAYNSASHYLDHVYMARRWVKRFKRFTCSQLSQRMIEAFVLERRKVSAYTANKEIRYLRALFNFGKKKRLVRENPVDGIDFLPVEKRIKYVPPVEDIDKVFALAEPDDQDYLWAIRETMARVSEINRLTWDEVDLRTRTVILYTRKKRGGHLTPRRVPMTAKLYSIFARRYKERDPDKPWVFWRRYWSWKTREWKEGPYFDRQKLMRRLCRQAGVKYFRFHALRHAGASLLENSNVPIGTIQRILGHENRLTTEIYLHSIGDAERSAMLVYEEMREKVSHQFSHQEKRGLTIVA